MAKQEVCGFQLTIPMAREMSRPSRKACPSKAKNEQRSLKRPYLTCCLPQHNQKPGQQRATDASIRDFRRPPGPVLPVSNIRPHVDRNGESCSRYTGRHPSKVAGVGSWLSWCRWFRAHDLCNLSASWFLDVNYDPGRAKAGTVASVRG